MSIRNSVVFANSLLLSPYTSPSKTPRPIRSPYRDAIIRKYRLRKGMMASWRSSILKSNRRSSLILVSRYGRNGRSFWIAFSSLVSYREPMGQYNKISGFHKHATIHESIPPLNNRTFFDIGPSNASPYKLTDIYKDLPLKMGRFKVTSPHCSLLSLVLLGLWFT